MTSTGNIRRILLLPLLLLALLPAWAQKGSITGKVMDEATKAPIPGATIYLIGTANGAISGEDGTFTIQEVSPGDYSIRVVIEDFGEQIVTGITVVAGQATKQDAFLKDASTTLGVVEIVGEALITVDDGQSKKSMTGDDIKETNARTVEDVAKMQAGVNESPDGLQFRGGRVYETKYMVEDVSAKDPLAGTGFGVSVGTSAVSSVDVTTGGAGAEYGDGTSGVVNTRIREGSNKVSVGGSWYRDNFFVGQHSAVSWNSDNVDLAVSGPLLWKKKMPTNDNPDAKPVKEPVVTFFVSGTARLTDTYFGAYANQLHSSLFTNDSLWAPRQDNSWSNTAKLTWTIRRGMKLSVTNTHSLNINQNSRTLQIVGNDAIMTPGFPYPYSLNLDNATTYTHHSNLTVANFRTFIDSSSTWLLDVTAGRLFTNLRADANGRPFREETVDMLYDPASIVTNPINVFNPGDSVVYVFPGPGLYNNGGIGTLWHDHYAQEYTLKYKFVKYTRKKVHMLTFGQEHKEQEYQWVDVTRPWVGAPIVIDDTTTTPSTSVGSSSDLWKARPANGGFFFQDEIRYKGIIAFLGFRFDYWAPGKFADNAVANPEAPVVEEIRKNYLSQTTPILGRRFKARLLPKVRVSFPVTENNVLYFNYSHSTLLPHPRFVYAGLDPVYQDRSFLSNLGNPNINPEVTVGYEVGLKSQINKTLAFTFTAFYNDKFDYIVSRRILIEDNTGRLVEKTFYINQDYARIRGVEVEMIKELAGRKLRFQASAGYQIATGKSNTAAESALQIKTQGFVATSQENYLAWDRPFDVKASLIYRPDTASRIFGVKLHRFRFFVLSTFKSGLRYTPYVFTGNYADSGRPIYEADFENPFSKIGAPWFWTDVRISRDFVFGKRKPQTSMSLSFEVKNVFNNKNSQILNGVTGRAYRDGDPLPIEYRDPYFPDPQDNGIPPFNPARYLQPRQIMWGLTFNF